MSPLRNTRHEHFAHLVSKGEPPTAAYVAAGYGETGARQSAARLLRDASICARIAQLQHAVEQPARERAIEKAAVDKAWVLNNLIKVVAMGMAVEPVLGKDGKPTGEYRANLPAANKALELVGKELGMFIDRKEIRTGPLDDLARDDLKQLHEFLDTFVGAGGTDAGRAGGATH